MLYLEKNGRPLVFILGAKWDCQRVGRWLEPYITKLQKELVVMIGVRHWFPHRYVAFSFHFHNSFCFMLRSHPSKKMIVHEVCHCLYSDWSEAKVKAWVKEQCQHRVRG